MIKKIVKPYLSHIITWVILFLLPFISYLYEPKKLSEFDFYFVKSHFLNILIVATIFYLNLYVIAPKYFFEKKRLKFKLLIFTLLAVYISFSYLTIYFSPVEGFQKIDEQKIFFFRLVVGPMIVFSLCILTSTMLFLYEEQAKQKELNKLIELEKTAAELNMLKLQISPHFLFNTLNNIRWLIRKKSELSEESVMKLSEILRYILYDVEGNKVDFNREMEHLKNFIELQTLRLPIAGTVAFEVDDSIPNFIIEPLLFIHFVENAFKYGIDSKNAPDIHFKFKKIANGIIFKSKNKILLKKTTIHNEGIGLTNIQRRLELLYPNKHELNINHSTDYFEVTLKLMLDEN